MKIAICGVMCSGKSTIAELIRNKLPNTYIISFADKIKDLAYELFDMKDKNRTLLINIGEKMKEINDKVWINYTIKQSYKHDNIIIDDLRFENEYKELIKHDFILIKLNISKELQIKRLQNTYPNNWDNHLKHIENERNNINKLDDKYFNYIIDIDKDEKNINDIINSIIINNK